MRKQAAAARVQLTSHPAWWLRARGSLPRWALIAAATWGILASMRLAIAPPRPLADRPEAVRPAQPEVGFEGFALAFARTYLQWSSARPASATTALEAFSGSGMEGPVGLQVAARGSEQVASADIVAERPTDAGDWRFTVAAQTSRGAVDLSVTVTKVSAGRFALVGYPALVGAPAPAPARTPPVAGEVHEAALTVVVGRALRNYLERSPAELAADLAPGADVPVPSFALRVQSLQRPYWTAGGSVLAVVQAAAGEVQYTLDYQLGLRRLDGRWEIESIGGVGS